MNDSIPRNSELERDASRVVIEMTGSKSCEVKRIRRGLMTHKFAVELPSGETYVVRFYPETRSHVVGYEPDLVRRCAEAGARVPRVIGDSRTGPQASLGYAVYQMIEGETLSERLSTLSPSELRRLGEDIIENLIAIQRVELKGWGELTSAWEASSASWGEFIRSSFSEGLDAVRRDALLSSTLLNATVKIAESLDEFLAVDSTSLICGDLGLGNIVLDQGNRLAGLIDFEGALVGDPLVTLGYSFAGGGASSFFHSLSTCWQRKFGEIDWRGISFFSVLRALRLAKYASDPLPTGHPRDSLVSIFPGFEVAIAHLVSGRYPSKELSI
jgi:aminoglycoside phosphotransferase (APT) family kinase protein